MRHPASPSWQTVGPLETLSCPLLQPLPRHQIRGHQVYRHLTALSPLQERILELLSFSSRVLPDFAPFLTNRFENGRNGH